MTFMKTQNDSREVWVNTEHVVCVARARPKVGGNKGEQNPRTLIRLIDGVSEYDERSPQEVAQALVAARGPFA